jgi:DNA-binding CsgD family transcriptional regulator
MPTLWNLSAPETAFATAVKDASKWNIAMDVVASATGSFRAILLPVPQEKAPIIRLSESLRSMSEINYLDGWVQCDLGYRGVSKLVQDRVISNVDCGTPVEIGCDSLHPGALERVSLPYFAGVKVTADDKLYCLVIQRSIQQASFSAAELKDLANISSALSRAATEARALGLARAEGALSAFSVLGWPAVLLDHDGQLIHINQNAEQLLSGDVNIDVNINGGRIASFAHQATMVLDRELYAFKHSRPSIMLEPLMPLPRRGNRRPLLVFALRLSAISKDVFSRRQIILKFIDLDVHPQPSESVLCRYFALSAAEARLARGIATGKSLDVLANELNITTQTARHELKSVFAKLNVHRQPELVALLAMLLPADQI